MNHHLMADCWKTEDIQLRLVRNGGFVGWKSAGVVVGLYKDRFESESRKQIAREKF